MPLIYNKATLQMSNLFTYWKNYKIKRFGTFNEYIKVYANNRHLGQVCGICEKPVQINEGTLIMYYLFPGNPPGNTTLQKIFCSEECLNAGYFKTTNIERGV